MKCLLTMDKRHHVYWTPITLPKSYDDSYSSPKIIPANLSENSKKRLLEDPLHLDDSAAGSGLELIANSINSASYVYEKPPTMKSSRSLLFDRSSVVDMPSRLLC